MSKLDERCKELRVSIKRYERMIRAAQMLVRLSDNYEERQYLETRIEVYQGIVIRLLDLYSKLEYDRLYSEMPRDVVSYEVVTDDYYIRKIAKDGVIRGFRI